MQILLCGSMVLIEKTFYEKFKTELFERTKRLIVGDPLEKKTREHLFSCLTTQESLENLWLEV